jgi:hypothetical protein
VLFAVDEQTPKAHFEREKTCEFSWPGIARAEETRWRLCVL